MDGDCQESPDNSEANSSVYVCTDANFGGECDNYAVTLGECSNFPPAFQYDISSFGPQEGTSCCIFL
jgi:hypothetical protein